MKRSEKEARALFDDFRRKYGSGHLRMLKEIKKYPDGDEELYCYMCGDSERKHVYDFSQCLEEYYQLCGDCLKKIIKAPDDPQPTQNLTQRFRILARDGFRCRYCGRTAQEDGVKLEVDHIFPKSKEEVTRTKTL